MEEASWLEGGRRALGLRFVAASGMKVNWATKCLTDNDWDFDKAAAMFTEVPLIPHSPFPTPHHPQSAS